MTASAQLKQTLTIITASSAALAVLVTALSVGLCLHC